MLAADSQECYFSGIVLLTHPHIMVSTHSVLSSFCCPPYVQAQLIFSA